MVLKLKKVIQKYGIVTIVEKSMYAILLLLSFVAIMGTVYKVYDVAQKAGSPIGFVTVSMISLGILFFLFCLYIFYRIEKVVLERQKYLTILLFFVMFILYAVVFSYYRVLPVTDSFIDLDIAAYMANGGIVDSGNVMAKYVAAYPNNYFFIFLCTLILKPIISLPEFSIFQIFYVLNAVFMGVGTFLMWDLVRRVRSIVAANKVLLICVLNPIFYFYMFWVYTNTFSLPFIVGTLYFLVLWCMNKHKRRGFLYLLADVVIAYLGYKLRATSVFPLIAFVLVYGCYSIWKRNYKAMISFCLMMILGGGFLHVTSKTIENSAFDESVLGRGYPITNWLVVGSQGNGLIDTATEFSDYLSRCSDTEEMAAYCKEQLINNYKQLGLGGSIKLWGRKYATTWSAGYADMDIRTTPGETDSEFATYFTGDYNFLFRLYCNVFRIITFVGVMVFCWRKIRNSSVDDAEIRRFDAVVVLSVMGAMLFYVFWEAKTAYSVPFLMFLFYMQQRGLDSCHGAIMDVSAKVTFRKGLLITIGVGLLISGVLSAGMVYRAIDVHVTNRIDATQRGDVRVVEGSRIEQSFYVRKSFNQLEIVADCFTNTSEGTDYNLYILDENEKIIYQQMLGGNDIENGTIVLSLPEFIVSSSPQNQKLGECMTLVLEKEDAGEEGILFYTSPSNYFSQYHGTLTVDEQPYGTDLMLAVRLVRQND